MIKQLEVDQATREVRLVFRDLWNGQHERTEYRVVGEVSGEPVHERHPGEWDHLLRRPVTGYPPPGWYSVQRPGFTAVPFRTENTAAGPTVNTPCPRAANKRRKCALCKEEPT